MTTFRRTGMLAVAPCLFFFSPWVAAAQSNEPAAPAQTTSGPMIVERVKSGFLVARDFQVTKSSSGSPAVIG
jgi:hypothetical protein